MTKDSMRLGIVLGPYAPVRRIEDWDFDVEDVYFRPVLRGILDAVGDRPIELVYSYDHPNSFAETARERGLDGLIVLWITLTDLAVLPRLLGPSIPYIAIGTSYPDPALSAFPCIDAANREAGRLAAGHLLGLGHRRFGCVNLATSLVNHSDRLQGFEDTVVDAGIRIERQHLLTDIGYTYNMFHEYLDDWIRELAERRCLPTAIFACDFNMTDALVGALERYGIRIPDHVSVVGFDDPPKAALTVPPLTTIRQPAYHMGFRAAQRVLHAIDAPSDPEAVQGSEILAVELMARGSTAAPRALP